MKRLKEFLLQEITALSMWMSVRLLLVNMEEAVRILSTLISVCVQMDSQVGEISHQDYLPHRNTRLHLAFLLLLFGVFKIRSLYKLYCCTFQINPSLRDKYSY